MISNPTRIGKKFKIALSLFLNIAIILKINPISPKAAIAKVGIGIEIMFSIFMQIKIIKTILIPTDHLPDVVLGNKLSLIALSPYTAPL